MQSHTLKRILERVGEQSHGAVLGFPFGVTIELLRPPDGHDQFCVLKGVIAPGGIVPLHSHDDIEAFFIISGTMQLLTQGEGGLEWRPVTAGDCAHIDSAAPHAWRNVAGEPAVALCLTTTRMRNFFREACLPADSAGPPAPEYFAAVASRYGLTGYRPAHR